MFTGEYLAVGPIENSSSVYLVEPQDEVKISQGLDNQAIFN